jgi:hypothetical protein
MALFHEIERHASLLQHLDRDVEMLRWHTCNAISDNNTGHSGVNKHSSASTAAEMGDEDRASLKHLTRCVSHKVLFRVSHPDVLIRTLHALWKVCNTSRNAVVSGFHNPVPITDSNGSDLRGIFRPLGYVLCEFHEANPPFAYVVFHYPPFQAASKRHIHLILVASVFPRGKWNVLPPEGALSVIEIFAIGAFENWDLDLEDLGHFLGYGVDGFAVH